MKKDSIGSEEMKDVLADMSVEDEKLNSKKIISLIITIIMALIVLIITSIMIFRTYKQTANAEDKTSVPSSTTVAQTKPIEKKEEKIKVDLDGYGYAKGMKILITDKDTKKVPNKIEETFEIEVISPKNEKTKYKDDDKDGIITINNLAAGEYKVNLISSHKIFDFDNKTKNIKVLEKPVYKANKNINKIVKLSTGKEKDMPKKTYQSKYSAPKDTVSPTASGSNNTKPSTTNQSSANSGSNTPGPSNPSVIPNGFMIKNGKTYYYNNGSPVLGPQVINGVCYNFGTKGYLDYTIGVDISKWQGNINFASLKQAGYNKVIMRSGFRGWGTGAIKQDNLVSQYLTQAKAQGLEIHLYFFSQAINEQEAIEEASQCIALSKKYNLRNPVIFIDTEASGAKNNEGRADRLSRQVRTDVVKAFCTTAKNSGYRTGVYASSYFFKDNLDINQIPSFANIWVADYPNSSNPEKFPDRPMRYPYFSQRPPQIWQVCSNGRVPGINGNVDCNRFYGFID